MLPNTLVAEHYRLEHKHVVTDFGCCETNFYFTPHYIIDCQEIDLLVVAGCSRALNSRTLTDQVQSTVNLKLNIFRAETFSFLNLKHDFET